MQFDSNQNPAVYDEGQFQLSLSRYTTRTFLWMFLGLLTTFATALLVAVSDLKYFILLTPAAPFVILIVELVVVAVLAARLQKLSVGAATGLFFAYAVLNGLTFSSIFFLYDIMSIITIFALTALFFGAMALYGYVTKKDLTKIGRVLMFGVLFLLVFWVLALFINMSGMEIAVSFIGLAIFLGLTAYDTQKIKHYHAAYINTPDMLAKASIYAALQLYLDFINIFLYILRILGRNR